MEVFLKFWRGGTNGIFLYFWRRAGEAFQKKLGCRAHTTHSPLVHTHSQTRSRFFVSSSKIEALLVA
jgi:hypothetical protein